MVYFEPTHFYLLFLTFTGMTHNTLQCRIILRSGLSDSMDKNCKVISDFAGCLASKHAAMNSPFGPDMPELIAGALLNITKNVCGFQCAIRPVTDEQEHNNPSLSAMGDAFKICAFNFILQVRAKPKKTCDNLPDLVLCFIRKSKTSRSREAIELGRHVLAYIIQEKFGITCDRSFSTKEIQKRCHRRRKQ